MQEKTCKQLALLLPQLVHDPKIDMHETTVALWTTTAHLIIRVVAYSCYPFNLWALTIRLNPVGYLDAIASFLAADDSDFGRWLFIRFEKAMI